MRWKEYQPLVAEDAAFVAVEANLSGSRPRELFEDILEEVEEKYEKDKAGLQITHLHPLPHHPLPVLYSTYMCVNASRWSLGIPIKEALTRGFARICCSSGSFAIS